MNRTYVFREFAETEQTFHVVPYRLHRFRSLLGASVFHRLHEKPLLAVIRTQRIQCPVKIESNQHGSSSVAHERSIYCQPMRPQRDPP